MMPTLRIGSTGQSVRTLQEALNIWPDSDLAPLRVDYSFGPQTHAKVREFQNKSDLQPDGVVGQKTWEELKPLVDEILGLVGTPSGRADAMERIAKAAQVALQVFGWGPGPVVPSLNSQKIAAAIRSDPKDLLNRRQGGFSLFSIFSMAGASPKFTMRCPTITAEAEKAWQNGNRTVLNNEDLQSWCGIFCYYVYRCAGINLGGWVNHDKNVSLLKPDKSIFVTFSDPAKAFKGCIGVLDGLPHPDKTLGENHHFIVMNNRVEDGQIDSIDGNVFGPDRKLRNGGQRSVIAPNLYTYPELVAKHTYFLFPKALM
jgi:peptidoglycan hydrolase-like protein with peptidoglycan-binding domain